MATLKISDLSVGDWVQDGYGDNDEDLEINRDWGFERWVVFYRGDDTTAATELIDALYDMVIKLKEKGVI